jgi:hypothetical protein
VVPVLASDEGPVAPAHVIRPVETIADRFWFELPGSLDYLRAAFERTQAASHHRIALHLVDAQELATRSLCHLRVVRRNGPGSIEALELDCNV